MLRRFPRRPLRRPDGRSNRLTSGCGLRSSLLGASVWWFFSVFSWALSFSLPPLPTPEGTFFFRPGFVRGHDERSPTIDIGNVNDFQGSTRRGLADPNLRVAAPRKVLSGPTQVLLHLLFRDPVIVNVRQAGFRIVPEPQLHRNILSASINGDAKESLNKLFAR